MRTLKQRIKDLTKALKAMVEHSSPHLDIYDECECKGKVECDYHKAEKRAIKLLKLEKGKRK